ncbi:hypothetical protein ZIOFF_047695 [Zingiber officinale]|uniref:Phosphoadenosine phosphosulphate reductase domain-containing protein n=1 Tax=Zingiber officinale TaxID=94328 RepID=A0A8J5G6G6_ZINOF|nr:hypothetical protein ZIOFF_047695 [Zingiber officinale]
MAESLDEWPSFEMVVPNSVELQADFHPDLFIFGTNSFYTFTLNLTIFLLVMKTTTLTMNVASVIKDELLIAFSWSVIRDINTPINLFHYDITFLGVSYYNKGPHGLFFHYIHPPLGFPCSSWSSFYLCSFCKSLLPERLFHGFRDMLKLKLLRAGLSLRQKIVTDTEVFWNNKAEDVALIEYAKLTRRPFRTFSLDIGRMNPEIYRFFDTVEKHYRINIEYMFPDAGEHALVRSKGLFPFFEDGHQEYCQVRKVRPLRRMLKGLRTWITGQRKDQSPSTRANIPIVQVASGGISSGIGNDIDINGAKQFQAKLKNVNSEVVHDNHKSCIACREYYLLRRALHVVDNPNNSLHCMP